jgi:hypothetical protein
LAVVVRDERVSLTMGMDGARPMRDLIHYLLGGDHGIDRVPLVCEEILARWPALVAYAEKVA